MAYEMRISDWSSDVCSSDLDPADISDIYVRTATGSMVQLSNFLSVSESVSPQSLNHFNRLRAVKVQASIAPGYALGEVLEHMNAVARDVLPPTVQTDLDGQSREFRDSSGGIYLVFLMALAFIYLRSEEHTSELQSLMRISYAVFCLKKKKQSK